MKNVNVRNAFVLLLTTMLFAAKSLAAGEAIIRAEDGSNLQMTVAYINGQVSRMATSGDDGQPGYTLVRNGKAYMVSRQDGRTVVMSMDQLANMANSFGVNQSYDAYQSELLDFKATGKRENVAGYSGQVYEIVWKDNKGTHRGLAVLSKEPAVWQYTEAWLNMADAVARAMAGKSQADNSLHNFLIERRLGVLRLHNNHRVVSLSSKTFSPDYFELPAAPMQIPGFGSLFGAAGSSGGATPNAQNNGQAQSNQTQSEGAAWVEDKAERQAGRQKQRVDQEVDKATDKAIDGAVNKVFEKLFGN